MNVSNFCTETVKYNILILFLLAIKFVKQTSQIKEEFSATTDYICAEQTQLRLEMSDVASTIKLLESENLKLQTEIHRLNTRILGMKKISRNCNIELQAVPERRNENVLLLFKKLCEVVKAPLADENISLCRRVAKLNPSTNRPRNIVITLSTPRLRDLVLSATHRYNKTHSERGLTSFDLGVPGEACKIYVTEHLSPEQKNLHAAAKRVVKERNFKYVWVKYGQVYMRKDEGSSAILVKNLDSLSKLQ
jgi:hypothetical protein